ncbi:hypothetical protein EIN_452820 [Entamoeba invadens IP1]|uniref:Uncharacterized protein n=1 Tax=Entamoeba invadens IP1 TaxID=370355 RepID=L7FP36_ENTIV|nr:hypothetical protein EIN_452820 [Entamoeba invadens IP1]ELP89682.1 hypothetical protein EIN_452820 [Entamoeba invadens IP1]|eukprot:XP_004256453.1 hypothetical protein EIN_452820 [Entamoeba invadens IP1]
MSFMYKYPSSFCVEVYGQTKLEKRKQDEMKYTQKKREMRDLESYQQALLLALLNTNFGFSIEHPGKKSKVTATSPRLVSLFSGNEEIELGKVAKEQCELVMEEEIKKGLGQATALRRFEKNKRVFTQNLLFDICSEVGFYLESKPSRKSKKSKQIERIRKIGINGKTVFTQDDIVLIGKKLNEILIQKIVKEKKCVFAAGEFNVFNAFKKEKAERKNNSC